MLSSEDNAEAASMAVAVGSTAGDTATAHATLANSSSVISPVMTRARKKRKAASPASPVDCAAIIQVDGPDNSPPPSPASPITSVCVEDPQLPMEPCVCAPPPPPPWSHYLPSHARTVICGTCWLAAMGFHSKCAATVQIRKSVKSNECTHCALC